jgi:predicted nucleotidyltransferase
MNERFLNHFSKKLYHATDIEGRKNTEVIKTLRELQTELEKFPEFVGLSLYGSTMKGYSEEESDIDFAILYDERKSDSPINLLKAACDFIGKNNKIKLSPFPIGLNTELIKKLLASPERSNIFEGIQRAKMIFYNTIGNRAKAYRSEIVKIIESFNPQIKEMLIKELIMHLQAIEETTRSKLNERAGFDQATLDTAIRARKQLWEKRVRKFFSENNEKADQTA